MARGLRTSRSGLFGLISDEIATTPHAGELIVGAQTTALANGFTLVIINTGATHAGETAAIRSLLQFQVEGIIYGTMYHQKVHLPPGLAGVPTVIMNSDSLDPGVPAVIPDEQTGARRAVDELLQAGHVRIGFANTSHAVPARDSRLQGYRQALKSAGVSYDSALVVTADSEASGGYACGKALLQLPDPPTAVFCFNDRMAMGVYQAAAEQGFSIPRDLSVVGFDNQELIAAGLYPALTTVALPHREMGEWAARTLIDIIDGHADTAVQYPQLIDCRLVRRKSVHPPGEG
jgi:LacI family transcriptional regulator